MERIADTSGMVVRAESAFVTHRDGFAAAAARVLARPAALGSAADSHRIVPAYERTILTSKRRPLTSCCPARRSNASASRRSAECHGTLHCSPSSLLTSQEFQNSWMGVLQHDINVAGVQRLHDLSDILMCPCTHRRFAILCNSVGGTQDRKCQRKNASVHAALPFHLSG